MRAFLLILFIYPTLVINSQTNTYVRDLTALRSILQKTPSYKDQIRGEARVNYEALFDRLVADSLVKPGDYRYFYNLAQLIFPLRDNHLGFYQLTDYTQFQSTAAIEKYIATPEFRNYPKSKLNIDSLKSALEKKPTDSIEGIYHYGRFYSVGLFKSGIDEYTGVVLNSSVNLWEKGHIAIQLYTYEPGIYKAIYAHPFTRNYILYPVEKYRNQSLLNSFFHGSWGPIVYTKDTQRTDYVNLPPEAPKFVFRNITPDIQYLRIRSFQLNQSTIHRSKAFYDSIEHKLHAKYLILDLRNHEGGSKRASKNYRKLIRKYSKKGKVYVLLNNGTLSQAEIFTLKLRKRKNVTTAGQTTKGMLAYGSNSGKREKLPSGKYEIYITDMNGPKERLNYESYGIEPDIPLNYERDWIDQVIEIIRKK
jgi:hypothetical protein